MRVAAVVLAAGRSQRMGEQNKLLAQLHERPILASVLEAASGVGFEQVVVVTGYDHKSLQPLLGQFSVDICHNDDYASGMASSLRCGLAALDDAVEAALILLGDMPFVSAGLIRQLIGGYEPRRQRQIVVPVCQGRRGNPVLWSRQYFTAMSQLSGDTGARQLLQQYRDQVWELPISDPAIFIDVDTPQVLAALQAEAGGDG